MGVTKFRWTDAIDWEFVRKQAESAIAEYHDWERQVRLGAGETTPLLASVGEALIALAEFVGIDSHVYGRDE